MYYSYTENELQQVVDLQLVGENVNTKPIKPLWDHTWVGGFLGLECLIQKNELQQVVDLQLVGENINTEPNKLLWDHTWVGGKEAKYWQGMMMSVATDDIAKGWLSPHCDSNIIRLVHPVLESWLWPPLTKWGRCLASVGVSKFLLKQSPVLTRSVIWCKVHIPRFSPTQHNAVSLLKTSDMIWWRVLVSLISPM